MDPAKEIKQILKHYKCYSPFMQDDLTKLCHAFAKYRLKNYKEVVETFGGKVEEVKQKV